MTAALLPCTGSKQAHKKGLPWVRRFFQHSWCKAQPNPKFTTGGWAGTINGDHRSFAEALCLLKTMDFGRGRAGSQRKYLQVNAPLGGFGSGLGPGNGGSAPVFGGVYGQAEDGGQASGFRGGG